MRKCSLAVRSSTTSLLRQTSISRYCRECKSRGTSVCLSKTSFPCYSLDILGLNLHISIPFSPTGLVGWSPCRRRKRHPLTAKGKLRFQSGRGLLWAERSSPRCDWLTTRRGAALLPRDRGAGLSHRRGRALLAKRRSGVACQLRLW